MTDSTKGNDTLGKKVRNHNSLEISDDPNLPLTSVSAQAAVTAEKEDNKTTGTTSYFQPESNKSLILRNVC